MQAATKPHRLVLGFESEPAERLRLAQAGLNGKRTLEGRPGELWLVTGRSSGGVLRLKPDAPCERLRARAPGWTAAPVRQSSGSGLRLADAVPPGGSCLPRLEAARLADRMGEWSEAVRLYWLVLQSGCDDAHVHFRFAVLLRRTGGDLRRGLYHLRQATHLSPDRNEYRRELADVYDLLGFAVSARKQREEVRRRRADGRTTRAWRFWSNRSS